MADEEAIEEEMEKIEVDDEVLFGRIEVAWVALVELVFVGQTLFICVLVQSYVKYVNYVHTILVFIHICWY